MIEPQLPTNLFLPTVEFQGQEVRFVGSVDRPEWVAADLAACLNLPCIGREFRADESEVEVYNAFDLLGFAVEISGKGDLDGAENIYAFVRIHGLKGGTVKRLYHASRMYTALMEEKCEKSELAQKASVYLIGCKENNLVKIGFTTDLKKRLQALQVSSPFKLSVLCSVPGTHNLERKLHKEFSHLRLEGEWFKHHESIIEKFEHLTQINLAN